MFVYLFLPELKGVPLETVDAMFDAGISPRLMGTHPMRNELHVTMGAQIDIQAPHLGHDATKPEDEQYEDKEKV